MILAMEKVADSVGRSICPTCFVFRFILGVWIRWSIILPASLILLVVVSVILAAIAWTFFFLDVRVSSVITATDLSAIIIAAFVVASVVIAAVVIATVIISVVVAAAVLATVISVSFTVSSSAVSVSSKVSAVASPMSRAIMVSAKWGSLLASIVITTILAWTIVFFIFRAISGVLIVVAASSVVGRMIVLSGSC